MIGYGTSKAALNQLTRTAGVALAPFGIRVIAIAAGVEELLGATVGPGFRAKVAASVPDAAEARALTHLLLDDLPGAVLVSGYALRGDTGFVDMRADQARARAFTAGRIDLCSGFRRDGTMLVELETTGRMPMPTGPPAPRLEPPDDELAWHEHGDLPVGGIRRRRRLDLTETATTSGSTPCSVTVMWMAQASRRSFTSTPWTR